MQKIYKTHLFIFNEIKGVQLFALFMIVASAGFMLDFVKNPFTLGMILLAFLPILQYSVGPFMSNANTNAHLIKSLDSFFSYLPFSEREKFLLILTDKIYISLPASFVVAYLSTNKNFNLVEFLIVGFGLLFLFIGQNLYMYRMSKYNEVDRQLGSHFYFKWILSMGRGMLLHAITIAIYQLLPKFSQAFFIVSTLFFVFQISMYFWKSQAYEKDAHKISTKLITQSGPVLFCCMICVVATSLLFLCFQAQPK